MERGTLKDRGERNLAAVTSWSTRVPAMVAVVALVAIVAMGVSGTGGSSDVREGDPVEHFQMYVSNVDDEHLDVIRQPSLEQADVQAWWDYWADEYGYEYDDIEDVVAAYFSDELFERTGDGETDPRSGVTGDVAFAHAISQSGWFQAEARTDDYNFAGVASRYEEGTFETYDSVEAGVRGHLMALYDYVQAGNETWPALVGAWGGDGGGYWEEVVSAVYGSMLAGPPDGSNDAGEDDAGEDDAGDETTVAEDDVVPEEDAADLEPVDIDLDGYVTPWATEGNDAGVMFSLYWPSSPVPGIWLATSLEAYADTEAVVAHAIVDGEVVEWEAPSGCDSGVALLSDPGTERFLYCSLDDVEVAPGDEVEAGDRIGARVRYDAGGNEVYEPRDEDEMFGFGFSMQVREDEGDSWVPFCNENVLWEMVEDEADREETVSARAGACLD